MASSLASTSRLNAALMSQACSVAENIMAAASSSAVRSRSARSSVSAGKQRDVSRRRFSTLPPSRSAWAAGHDVDGEEGRSTSTTAGARLTSLPPTERTVTVDGIAELKGQGEPVAVLTAYDYSSALSVRGAPVDICLVGDSLANVALGMRSTQLLSLDAMVHHVQAVARGLRHASLNQPGMPAVPLLIADMPYGYAQGSLEAAVQAATTLVHTGGADGIKIEGSNEVLPLVERLAAFGMPVMAHIGLQPQRASSSSAFQLQGRTAKEAIDLLHTALRLEKAGAFSTVIECVPNRVGAEITKRLRMVTIGIGAGKGCDGQVLVADDILGECSSPLHVLANVQAYAVDGLATTSVGPSPLWPSPPRFVRSFAGQVSGGSTVGAIRLAAVQAYVEAVKARTFPSDDEGYKMKRDEWAAFKAMLDEHDRAAVA